MAKKQQTIHHNLPYSKIIWVTIALAITIIVYLLGSQRTAFKHFEQNELLNSAEKTYAKKSFHFVYKFYKHKGKLTISPKDLSSRNYKKWGLGADREFSKKEIAYIVEIHNMVKIWEIYNNINLNDLSESEQLFLKAVHNKHGATISIADLTTMNMDGFFPEDIALYDMVFGMVEFLFDLHKVDDFVIIFINRLEQYCVV